MFLQLQNLNMFHYRFLKTLALAGALAVSISVAAQDSGGDRKLSESELRTAIAARDSVISEIKKPRELADTLVAQVADYGELVALLDNRIDSLATVIAETPAVDYSVWPLPLLSEDVSVFKIEDLAGRTVPPSLQQHYDVVCAVAEIDSLMAKTKKMVKDLEAVAQNNGRDAKPMVRSAISEDVSKLHGILKPLGKTDELVTLSPAQKQYVDGLKKSYNELSKYFQ